MQNQCLVNQYNQFGTDGRATLNNNFADGVGLYVVEALLKNQTSNKIIPGLNAWNKDQLAYIQFARMKCSKSTREHKVKVVVHSIFVLPSLCFTYSITKCSYW